MSFPSPAYNPCLEGHQQQQSLCLKVVQSQRLIPLLLQGMQGVGKATTAYHLARACLNHTPWNPSTLQSLHPPEQPTAICKQIANGLHPHCYCLQASEEEPMIPIEEVRHMKAFLQKTQVANHPTVVIIDALDSLTPQAQNSILKILEEPPLHVLFLLISHQFQVLSTIQSRCLTVPFSSLTENTITAILDKLSITCPKHIIHEAQGSMGYIAWITEDKDTLSQDMTRMLSEDPCWWEIYKMARLIATDAKAWQRFLRSLRHKILSEQKNAVAPSTKTAPSWFNIWDMLGKIETYGNTLNVDKQLLVFLLCSMLSQAMKGHYVPLFSIKGNAYGQNFNRHLAYLLCQ